MNIDVKLYSLYYIVIHFYIILRVIFFLFQDIDECAVSTTCHTDAVCTNIIDGDLRLGPQMGFTCSCPAGWLGDGLPAPVGTGCTVLLKCPVGQYGIFAKSCKKLPQYGACHPSLGLRNNIFEHVQKFFLKPYTQCT